MAAQCSLWIWVANGGKTKVAIDIFANHTDKIKKVLIVCPHSVIDVWPKQIRQHSYLEPVIVALNEGTVAQKTKVAEMALRMAEAKKTTAVIVINYESLWREPFASFALKVGFDMGILDECVPTGTTISTPGGDRPIETIKKGDLVFGEKDGQIVLSEVTHTFVRNGNNPLLNINGLNLTGNHPVWTSTGYKDADTVTHNNDIVMRIVFINDGGRDTQKGHPFEINGMVGFAIYEPASIGGNVSYHHDDQRLHNLETTTGNYFANGILVHNCHRIKSPGGKTSKFCDKLSRTIPYRLGLSGTPLSHSPLDIYGQYRYLDPGIFGTSFARFRNDYAVMGGFQNHQVLQYRNLEDLQAKMYSIAFRVKSSDVFDLPPFQDITRECTLDPNDMAMYRELDEEFCVQVRDEIITADNALVKMLRLQELTSGYLEKIPVNTCKQKLLADVMEDFAVDEPVVVFARFTNDLKAIKKIAEDQGRKYAELSGNAHELSKWQDGDADVLGVQIKSGKEGVDFTRARYCIYYSIGSSLGDYLQSRKRVDRPGQTREGIYIHLIAKGTIDVKVMRALERSEEIVESVLNQTKETMEEVA